MAVNVYESAMDVEWLDEEQLDTSDVPVAESDNSREEQITVNTTEEYLCSPLNELQIDCQLSRPFIHVYGVSFEFSL